MTYEEAINELKEYAEVSWGGLAESFECAIEALEKQIPKKVGKLDMVSYGSLYFCPECEIEITPVVFFNADDSEPEEKVSYCWKCGQAIDWSSEDGR